MERLTISAKELRIGDRVFPNPPPRNSVVVNQKQLQTDTVTKISLDLCDGTVDVQLVRGQRSGVVSGLAMDLELEVLRDPNYAGSEVFRPDAN